MPLLKKIRGHVPAGNPGVLWWLSNAQVFPGLEKIGGGGGGGWCSSRESWCSAVANITKQRSSVSWASGVVLKTVILHHKPRLLTCAPTLKFQISNFLPHAYTTCLLGIPVCSRHSMKLVVHSLDIEYTVMCTFQESCAQCVITVQCTPYRHHMLCV